MNEQIEPKNLCNVRVVFKTGQTLVIVAHVPETQRRGNDIIYIEPTGKTYIVNSLEVLYTVVEEAKENE
jgi:hypothetical protein